MSVGVHTHFKDEHKLPLLIQAKSHGETILVGSNLPLDSNVLCIVEVFSKTKKKRQACNLEIRSKTITAFISFSTNATLKKKNASYKLLRKQRDQKHCFISSMRKQLGI